MANEYDNGKPFEKEFVVGLRYQNRHNGRYVVVTNKKITDTGLDLFRVLSWDIEASKEILGDFDYLPAGDIVHWQVV